TNEWLGIEGDATATFGPTVFANESVRFVSYGAGPKIAWRQRQWEPWMHAIIGGAHLRPQTAGSSNALAIQLGGGADYRLNPRPARRTCGVSFPGGRKLLRMKRELPSIRVLGVDPAAAGPTGYGIIEGDGRQCRMLHYGALCPAEKRRRESAGGTLRAVHEL